jgi:hypothetical protein
MRRSLGVRDISLDHLAAVVGRLQQRGAACPKVGQAASAPAVPDSPIVSSPLASARTRRHWLVLLGAGAVGRALADAAPTLEVWVDLSEPVPASAPDAAEAKRRAQGVARQQHQVLQALKDLGATELGRARHARNAIAVRIAAERLDAVRALPGVLRVRAAEDLHPPRPTPLP